MTLDVLALLLVLAAALGGGWVANRLGYPAILGEIMAGIVLGPPLLGLLTTNDAISVIGKLGVVLLMLYIGLHLDPGDLGKAAKPAAWASLGGFIVPAALGFGLMVLVGYDPIAATFVAVAMGVTSLATKSRILVDLGILNTRIAHVLMAGALFSDVAALIVFAAVLGIGATGAFAAGTIASAALSAIAFLAASFWVGTRILPRLGRFVESRRLDNSVLFLLVVMVGLTFAAAAELAGLHSILGAFLAGLFIKEGVLSHDRLHEVEAKAKTLSVGVLAPVFFVTAGFKVSFDVFTESPWLLAGVVVLATVGKIFGTAFFYLFSGNGFREGVAVGAGMNGRGAVEIIVAELALSAGLIDATVFSILVFMAIFTTATVPVFLTRAVEWLKRHDQLVADERDHTIIVGAGPVARVLAEHIGSDHVTLIDPNAEHCRAAERRGLTVLKGSALDEDLLAEAGAPNAKALLAATPNAEVNLLAARLASRRFGVPELHVALPEDVPSSNLRLLDEVNGQLLFSRQTDVAVWDADIEQGRVEELTYTVAEPEAILARGSAVLHDRATMVSLPLVIETGSGIDLFTGDHDLTPDDRVIALGKPGPLPRRVLPHLDAID
ncbi:MAG: sodium:proton exchanger [Acidimicrobiia bacterium]|nr:sodium:proton exchanger [Acidimicrobiia bacterium]